MVGYEKITLIFLNVFQSGSCNSLGCSGDQPLNRRAKELSLKLLSARDAFNCSCILLLSTLVIWGEKSQKFFCLAQALYGCWNFFSDIGSDCVKLGIRSHVVILVIRNHEAKIDKKIDI